MALFGFLLEKLFELFASLAPETTTLIIIIMTVVIMLLLSKVMSSRVPTSESDGVFTRTDDSLLADLIPPSRGQVRAPMSLMSLTKFNYTDWYIRVVNALAAEDLTEAVKQPLPEYDRRNLAAYIKIDDSVPGELKQSMGTTRIAFVVMANLKQAFGKPGYTEHTELREEIKAMKLGDRPTREQVDKHLEMFVKKVGELRQAGVEMDDFD